MSEFIQHEASDVGKRKRSIMINNAGLRDLRENVEDDEIVEILTAEYVDNIKENEFEIQEALKNEYVAEEIQKRNRNLYVALSEHKKLSQELATQKNNITKLKRLNKNPIVSKKIVENNEELLKTKTALEELKISTPEAYYGLTLKKLKEYQAQLENDELVKTEYIVDQKDSLLNSMNSDKPAFVHGHHGSGKTELCIETARDYSGQNPLLLSGTKFISISEFYGHQKLSRSEFSSPADFLEKVEKALQDWKRNHYRTPTPEEVELAHTRIVEAYKPLLGSSTISDFHLGPVYQAMEEGRVLIIDEVNSIPHNILISLNHILTRKTGDKVYVQQDSGKEITIRKGFGIMMTGNLNSDLDIYKEREDLDAAFLDRLDILEQDYLPQASSGDLEHNQGNPKELFEVLISKLMDKNGNLMIPKDCLEKIWQLSAAARNIQDVFSGKVTQLYQPTPGAGGVNMQSILSTSCSMRPLMNIIQNWQSDGFVSRLDDYIFSKFIKKSQTPTEQHLLYQIFDNNGFFDSNDYDITVDQAGGQVVSFDLQPKDAINEKSVEQLHPREYIDKIYGKYQPPNTAANQYQFDFAKYGVELRKAGQLEHFNDGGLWGYRNRNTQSVLVEPQYNAAYGFSQGRASVYENRKGGFLLPDGSYLVEPKYDRVGSFRDGAAKVVENGKTGFVGLSGEVIIQPKYETASDFVDGYSIVKNNGKFGLIDKSDTAIIGTDYKSVDFSSEAGYIANIEDENGNQFKVSADGSINPI